MVLKIGEFTMKTFINKTFLAIVATVLVAGTAFFTSCEKDEDNSNIAVGESKSSNGENPFDFIGEKHNEILNYMGFELKDHLNELAEKEEISDKDREEFFNHIIEILPDVVAQNSILDISKEEFDIVLENFYESLENDEYDNYMSDDPNFQVLKDILNEASYISDIKQHTEFIEEKELEVLSYANEFSDTCIIIFLNVYRHSALYWEDAFNNPNNPWNNFLQSSSNWDKKIFSKEEESRWNKFWDKVSYKWYKFKQWVGDLFTSDTWLVTATADAMGALLGVYTGSVAGPVGITTCSIFSGTLFSLGWPLITI